MKQNPFHALLAHLRALVNRHHRLPTFSNLPTWMDGDDVIQEVALRLWESFQKAGNTQSLKDSFLRRIAVNLQIDATRRQKTIRHHQKANQSGLEIVSVTQQPLSQSPEHHLAWRQLTTYLDELAATSGKAHRKVQAFYLSVLEERPWKEVAASLGTSERTAMRYVEDVKQRLWEVFIGTK